ncbi:FAD-dependent oxidoreductase [Pseudonocardia sp. TRM90224]|uniref:FAD-dependent oxidoreductase n=1 Tax=Pseudonocardia sp. TRM90224 TaxID=2812678 RepID=UPI001E2D90B5|nr:FAD-dependent oxidoreductase [Pseudonocardia sp. TRM90224]
MTGSPYQRLLAPLTVRGKQIRNRIVSSPHATGWEHAGGLISDKEVEYHVRKAAGGVGLVMTFGSASVDPATAASYGAIALWNPANEPQLRRLADGVHAHGGLVMSQMTHMGHRGSSRVALTPVRGVSDIPEPEHREVALPLTVPELHALAEKFAEVARRLHRCGWDGAEVTSFAHLIEQFWDPAINTRTDEYGGSLENRMRFGKEVVAAVRAAVPDDFLVGFRMSLDPRSGGRRIGTAPDQLLAIATAMAATGDIDLLSVTGGDAMTKPALSVAMGSEFVEPVTAGAAAARVRGAVNVPVMLAGRVNSGAAAEGALAAGQADLVIMTRALIADPDLPTKLAAGGRVRPCIGINQGCIGRLYQHLPIVCSVNPAIRDPQLDRIVRAATRRRVVVVGGGVAGLEAARTAALRGHDVVLLERAEHLGGRAWLNATHGWRPAWQQYLDHLAAELAELGVRIECGVAAGAGDVLALDPDAVVVATGSRLRELPGGVVDADTVIAEVPRPTGSGVAVLIDDDGGFVAPIAAAALAGRGWAVTIATPLPMLAGDVDATQIRFVHERLAFAAPTVLPDLRFLPGPGPDVELEHVLTGAVRSISAPGIVVAAGHRRAENVLHAELRATAPGLDVRLAGDALAPRGFDAATAEGALTGADL